MVANSKIQWTDHTFNPFIGCQKVSPGCDNCYAETLMDTRLGRVKWGPHGDRIKTSEANWRKPIAWAKHAPGFRLSHGRRQRVFCASLSDWLDNKAPQEWRVELANLIEATPELDWLLLTKRIENFERFNPWSEIGKIPFNVWIGVTAEDQHHFDRRWKILREIEAPVRFISYEPAIGPLRLMAHDRAPDWLICGGESGANPREMDRAWARRIRDDCADYGTAFFMKQMTGKTGDDAIPTDLMIRQFPEPRR